ncbi:MAG: hypothetical protein ACI4XC_06730, partial [Eubacterium sp.]
VSFLSQPERNEKPRVSGNIIYLLCRCNIQALIFLPYLYFFFAVILKSFDTIKAKERHVTKM